MMADEVRRQRPGWKVHWANYDDFDAQIPKIQRSVTKDAGIVCLFVKTHDDNLAKRCRHELHATVMLDTVDNMKFLHHADDAAFLRKHHLDGVIVQTTKKAEEARQRDLNVFYIPHHHTNLASLHRSPHSFKTVPRTIGVLCGSKKNLPPEKEQYAIARATCSFGASFVVIEQGRTLPLTTTVTRFQCIDGTVTVTKEVSTDRKQPDDNTEDPYQQLPFHRHPIFQEVDLAILWPPSFGDDWTEVRNPPWSHSPSAFVRVARRNVHHTNFVLCAVLFVVAVSSSSGLRHGCCFGCLTASLFCSTRTRRTWSSRRSTTTTGSAFSTTNPHSSSSCT